MKRLLLLLLMIPFLSCNHNHSDTYLKELKNKLSTINKEIVPDKRDHIFNIDIIQKNDSIILSGTTDFSEGLSKLKEKINIPELIDNVKILPEKRFTDMLGITRLSVANLRAKPKHSAELVTQTLMGTPLKVFQEKNDFYQVKTPEGYYAWIDSAGLLLLDKQNAKEWFQKEKIIVTSIFGQAYKTEMCKEIVSDICINDVFEKISQNDNFIKIGYPDGRIGIVKKDKVIDLSMFTSLNNDEINAEEIVEHAKNFIGTPYLWGGTSSKGLDCSGFTKTVYANFNYLLPRDASQQVKIGKKIDISKDFSNLQPADLLFFGRIKDGKEKITHVAIHLRNGRIIHATGEVKIESLNKNDKDYNSYRHNSLLQARRIIGNYPQNLISTYKQ